MGGGGGGGGGVSEVGGVDYRSVPPQLPGMLAHTIITQQHFLSFN